MITSFTERGRHTCLEKEIVSESFFEESDHEQAERYRKSELRSKIKMFMHGLVGPKKE